MNRIFLLACAASCAFVAGCGLPRKAIGFGIGMELGIQDKPGNWAHLKDLAFRPAPRVGDAAPDFTLTSLDGETKITRSTFQDGRPLVLVFGSFT